MSRIHKNLRQYGLALLGAVVVGCSSSGTGNNTGTIVLGLNPTSASVVQGNQTAVTATLTRGGGFTGTVNLTVTGAPTGVTATVSNVVTTGLVTTATVTVAVAAATVPGVYPLVVHGTGSGVTEATFSFSLTVTAAPAPSYLLTLSSPTVSIVQGGATPTVTVNLARTNFTGNIALSVDGLPTGVTAAFAPANPQTGNSAVLTLTVPAATPTGTTNLTVRGTATGLTDRTAPLALTVTAPASGFTLSLTQATLSIAQGASTPTTTVNITRTNFTGDVALSVLNLPTGVSASFAPANPQTGNSSVLTLTVAPGAPTGVFTNLSVQGVGTTGTVATPLSLTITAGTPAGNFTLSTTPPTSVSLVQGATAQVTVNVNRTGGNTSSIALTTTGTLPAGMTLALPSPTVTNSSTLTITTTALTPVGSYPFVIHGNTAGLGEQTADLTINVSAPAGSGNVTVTFASCPAASKAVWLAFMDGTAGTWTAVTGVGDVYNFNITQGKGSFAYVTLGTGTSNIVVQHMTQTELTGAILNFCAGTTPTGETINGTIAGLQTGQIANVSFGGGFGLGASNGPVQVTGAADGSHFLVAYAKNPLIAGGGDRIYIDPVAQNPANGGNFANTIDFAHATNSFGPDAATFNLNGTAGGETIFQGMTFYSGTGGGACMPASLYGANSVTGTTFVGYGVPVVKQPAGGMHQISVTAINGTTSFRSLIESFVDVTARAATPLVLPASLPTPVATDAGGPYKRPSVTVTGIPAEFNLSHSLLYQDQTVAGKTGFISATQGWVGGSNVTLVLPDFSGVVTFNNAWAPATGDAVNWTFSSSGGTFTSVCAAGQRFVTSTRSGAL